MSMFEGDFLCNDCFTRRKNTASSSSCQDLLEKNWGLYLVPFVGLGLFASRLKKDLIDNCNEVWHVYTNGRHEVWHDSRTNDYNKKKCKECNDYYSYFYELVNVK